MKLSALKPDPQNRRLHSPRNRAMVVDALKAVGAARSIVIDEDNVILAGNGVADGAPDAGIDEVRVIEAAGNELIAVRRIGLTPDQKRALALYDNRAAELATWDAEALQGDLREGMDLAPFFFAGELHELFATIADKPGATDPDALPPERATAIVRGDLFALGRHRLLCGDATNAADVAAVLGDARPGLMVTDPPYGIEYDPAWRARAGVNKNTQKLGVVSNDDEADWTEAWRLFPGDVAYVWHAALRASIVEASLVAAGFALRSQIIWAKDRLALSRGDYHWQHEPAWYAVREGRAGERTDDRSQSTVWAIPARDDAGHGHGTQKPVALMARPMKNHTFPDVYEPFAGSGSTLIAAEQLGRRCFAIELEPRYCQIVIDRWTAFTGMTPVRVGAQVPGGQGSIADDEASG